MEPLLADTCLAIWLMQDAPLAAASVSALGQAADRGNPIFVSPITAWEVGLLVARGRLKLSLAPLNWFEAVLTIPGFQIAALPARVLVGANFLPGNPPSDPADRIIAATARDLDATLMTRDRLLLAYAEQGHIRAIAC